MKIRTFLIGVLALAMGVTSLSAQADTTGQGAPVKDIPLKTVYKPETITTNKKPVPYPYVREADVMWAKTIWRSIDLRHRQNMPLRYPLEGSMSDGERYSLFGLLMKGIEEENLTAYAYNPITGWKDPFTTETSLEEIYRLAGGYAIFDDNGDTIDMEISMRDVMQFQIMEQWFFDKQTSTMQVRILAMAPVYYMYYDEFGNTLPAPRRQVPFIVHFPEYRGLFATHAIYNPKNDAQSISFDDLFMQRRFSSTVIAESNSFGNRMLSDYKIGQDILLEAERIKQDLFQMEHDLWEY